MYVRVGDWTRQRQSGTTPRCRRRPCDMHNAITRVGRNADKEVASVGRMVRARDFTESPLINALRKIPRNAPDEPLCILRRDRTTADVQNARCNISAKCNIMARREI